MKNKLLAVIIIGLGVIGVEVRAAEKCNFTRDLDLGATGEDVLCLQKFLNSEGFKISDSGPGSPGGETNLFRDKTKEALKRWQGAKSLSPASGYFGTLSRAAYEATILQKELAAIVVSPPPTTPTPVVKPVSETSDEERQSRSLVKSLRKLVKDARDDVEDAEDNGDDVAGLSKILDKAEENLIDALYAFIDKDYNEALSLLELTEDYVDDVKEDVGGDEDDADEAIEDADEAIDDAKDEIDDADDDGDDVDEAEDLIDEADDTLDEAKEAFDEGDYDDAEELAQEAKDLAEEAVNAIGN